YFLSGCRALIRIFLMIRALLTICFCVFLSGCRSTGKHLQWYPGPGRRTNEVALVDVQRSFLYASAFVETIDGKSVTGGHWYVRNNSTEIELLPGTHTLGVAYREGTSHS